MRGVYLIVSFASTCLALTLMLYAAPKRGRRVLPWAVLTIVIGWLAFISLFIVPKEGALRPA